ncbi:hypothetical protein HNQ63_001178 [Wenzhouxiangella marina]|uniref:Uncharacterized protein n=1 Tax=Wenzhouxiangella marina TaxID=1579979 RepID=A0A0K0XV08_9GAMM|nr:hypothetical protein WM2015_1126 [Wenzhouxiangella marina]MBB6086741.1 hypothetical protein [Wenzhouxiangella marina]
MEPLRFPQYAQEATAQCRQAWMKGIDCEQAEILMQQQTE